jgi:HEAT repeat protein
MISRLAPADDRESRQITAESRGSRADLYGKSTFMRPRPEEKKLEMLGNLDAAADRAVQSAALEPFLADKHFRVVSKAATLAGERSLVDLTPLLLTAYARFLEDPVKRDPNCIAKGAIARALVNLGCDDVDFYLAGIRYTQPEPVWGGSADSAIDVRCSCALGLVNTRYSRAIQELTTLLHDKEARARVGAAHAISCGNPREAEAVLRLKVLVGDAEAEVIGECFTGLMSIAPLECLPFVATHLSSDNQGVRDYAALALGESRNPKVVEYLKAAWDASGPFGEFPIVLIRAAALNRTEAAFDWLMAIIETGAARHSDAAVEALSVYERNAKLSERVKRALENRRTLHS